MQMPTQGWWLQRSEGGSSDTLKLAGIVITAAGLAIFLLWLLFSGSSPQTVLPEARVGPACLRAIVLLYVF